MTLAAWDARICAKIASEDGEFSIERVVANTTEPLSDAARARLESIVRSLQAYRSTGELEGGSSAVLNRINEANRYISPNLYNVLRGRVKGAASAVRREDEAQSNQANAERAKAGSLATREERVRREIAELRDLGVDVSDA